MNIKAYAFLAGYLDKEAGKVKDVLKEGARFTAYSQGGGLVGAGLGAGVGALAHPEAMPMYAAGGGATGYILGLLLKAKIDQRKGLKERDVLRSKKDPTEQDSRNLAVLEDLSKQSK